MSAGWAFENILSTINNPRFFIFIKIEISTLTMKKVKAAFEKDPLNVKLQKKAKNTLFAIISMIL